MSGLPSLEQGPAYSLLPPEIVQPVQAALAVASEEHNRLLKAEIQRFQTLVHPRMLQLEYFDLGGLFDSITQADNLEELGITVTNSSCIEFNSLDLAEVESVCQDPAQFTFYDPLHYTTTIHREVAKGIAKALDRKVTAVPY
ncbi:hypothetical protein DUNSADRAFT_15883 [Dunaliella salina]|uniref:Uncharacterized protein n=1 Tax=Dunaliella salina TaxID=3046 RepID=A0ABQ7G4R9_DUNSA|nr:hypothetical protein DUNSADRAFT_15883 [Dunaliella salina]|eukprot:KAF5829584.1 hypothetical protein DUNSADRAFT_15883 [Dunaliella salina]